MSEPSSADVADVGMFAARHRRLGIGSDAATEIAGVAIWLHDFYCIYSIYSMECRDARWAKSIEWPDIGANVAGMAVYAG